MCLSGDTVMGKSTSRLCSFPRPLVEQNRVVSPGFLPQCLLFVCCWEEGVLFLFRLQVTLKVRSLVRPTTFSALKITNLFPHSHMI